MIISSLLIYLCSQLYCGLPVETRTRFHAYSHHAPMENIHVVTHKYTQSRTQVYIHTRANFDVRKGNVVLSVFQSTNQSVRHIYTQRMENRNFNTRHAECGCMHHSAHEIDVRKWNIHGKRRKK